MLTDRHRSKLSAASVTNRAKNGKAKAKDDRAQGHGPSQTNYMSRGRGHRFPQRYTPYSGGGRGLVSNSAVQALPPQEAQFNSAQAEYAHIQCFHCGNFGHYALDCTGQSQAPAWGQAPARGRGRGPSRVSLYSGAFGTHVGQRLERLFGCKPDRNDAQTHDHAECDKRDSGSDEFEYIGRKKKKVKVISGSMLRTPPGFDTPLYTVNALSSNGLRMMFDGCLAASPRTKLRILVDTGANRSFVSQQLIEKHDLKLTDNAVWMKLADGNTAISRGTCKLQFRCHDYEAMVPMMALRMNKDFDVILGCDWLQQNVADIMFSSDSLRIGRSQADGRTHVWPVAENAVSHSVKCSMVAAADLNKHLDCDDRPR